jgi:hypothetical protein
MKKPVFWIVLITVLAAAVGLYLWRQQAQQQERLEPLPVRAAEAPAPPPEASTGPQIVHALPAVQSPPDDSARTLPPLAESDEVLYRSLVALVGEQLFRGTFIPQDIVRHIVTTIDELPRNKVATRALPVKRPLGQTLTSGEGEALMLGPSNYARYRSYVKLTQAVDAKKLVAVYVHFYPLFQQAYQELGYPRYFNDRLVEVIDDLLEAPDVQGTVKLVRPRVMYEFAAPELEGLSAGQKILIRMGPENAAVIKAKLNQIRRQLVTQPP